MLAPLSTLATMKSFFFLFLPLWRQKGKEEMDIKAGKGDFCLLPSATRLREREKNTSAMKTAATATVKIGLSLRQLDTGEEKKTGTAR